MEQRSILSNDTMIMILRRQLEEAYAQSDFKAVQALSRQIDGLQLRRWQAACPKLLIPKN